MLSISIPPPPCIRPQQHRLLQTPNAHRGGGSSTRARQPRLGGLKAPTAAALSLTTIAPKASSGSRFGGSNTGLHVGSTSLSLATSQHRRRGYGAESFVVTCALPGGAAAEGFAQASQGHTQHYMSRRVLSSSSSYHQKRLGAAVRVASPSPSWFSSREPRRLSRFSRLAAARNSSDGQEVDSR